MSWKRCSAPSSLNYFHGLYTCIYIYIYIYMLCLNWVGSWGCIIWVPSDIATCRCKCICTWLCTWTSIEHVTTILVRHLEMRYKCIQVDVRWGWHYVVCKKLDHRSIVILVCAQVLDVHDIWIHSCNRYTWKAKQPLSGRPWWGDYTYINIYIYIYIYIYKHI